MDNEIQPTVVSDSNEVPISNSSVDSIDTEHGSYMLPTVEAIANQVSSEMRQSHPQCFSRLPIVVMQRYVPDNHTSVENNDSTACNDVLPNITTEIKNIENSQNKLKLNESVDNDDMSKITDETSKININHKDELSNVFNKPFSNSLMPINDTINCTKENVNTDANNKKNKKSGLNHDENLDEVPKDIMALKETMRLIYLEKINKNTEDCNNELNKDKMRNKSALKKIVDLDHDYYRSQSPENAQQEEQINDITLLTEKIDNIINDSLAIDSEPITIESLLRSIDGENLEKIPHGDDLVETESNGLPGLYKFYDNQRWKEFSNDVKTAEFYILSKLLTTFGRTDLTFIEMERIVSRKVKEIMRKTFDKHFERKNEEFMLRLEKTWREKYMRLVDHLREIRNIIIMHQEDLKTDINAVPRKQKRHVKVQTKRFKSKDYEILPPQEPVTAMHFTVSGVVFTDKSDKQSINSMEKNTPNTTMGTSTQTLLNTSSNSVSMSPISSSNFVVQPTFTTVRTQTISNPTSSDFNPNFENQQLKSVFVMSGGSFVPVQFAPITSVILPKKSPDLVPKITSVFSLQPESKDLRKLPPVPPAIPIDDDLPSSSTAHNEVCSSNSSLQQILQAPTKRSRAYKSSKVKTFKNDATTIDPSIEIINLLSPEPLEESEIDDTALLSGIENQEQPLPEMLPIITNVKSLKVDHEIDLEAETEPIEIYDLSSPEPSEVSEINIPSASNRITKRKHLRTRTQEHSTPKQFKRSSKVKAYKNDITSTTSNFETVSLLSPEPFEESEINDPEDPVNSSNESTEQNHIYEKAEQSLVSADIRVTSKVAEVTANENCAETEDLSQIEVISLLSPEHAEESEMNVPSTSSGITHQKRLWAWIPKQSSTLKKQKKSIEVFELNSDEDIYETDIELSPEIMSVSSPEPFEEPDIYAPSTSSGITHQYRRTPNILRPWTSKQKRTSKVAAELTCKNNTKTSSIESTEKMNSLPPEDLVKSNVPVAAEVVHENITETFSFESTEKSNSLPPEDLVKSSVPVATEVAHENNIETSSIESTEKLNSLPPEDFVKSNVNDPSSLIQNDLASLKLLPPAPTLELFKTQTSEDLIFILNMQLTSDIAKIRCFEIYCYNEESSEIPIIEDSWVKLSETDFKSLPMAIVFKKRTRNIKCHFKVRAVDVHNRVGPFSSSLTMLVV